MLSTFILIFATTAHAGGWNEPVGKGCAAGLVDESGRCCWPGQGATATSCVGPPSCVAPNQPLPTGDCGAPVCAEGQERTPDGSHCCWPGQVWSNNAGACVGTPTCPDGLASSPTGCGDAPAAAVGTRRDDIARGRQLVVSGSTEGGGTKESFALTVDQCEVVVHWDWYRKTDCASNPGKVKGQRMGGSVPVSDLVFIDLAADATTEPLLVSAKTVLGHPIPWKPSSPYGGRSSADMVIYVCGENPLKPSREDLTDTLFGSPLGAQVLSKQTRCHMDDDGRPETATARACLGRAIQRCRAVGASAEARP